MGLALFGRAAVGDRGVEVGDLAVLGAEVGDRVLGVGADVF
jgi:hypothetical protein